MRSNRRQSKRVRWDRRRSARIHRRCSLRRKARTNRPDPGDGEVVEPASIDPPEPPADFPDVMMPALAEYLVDARQSPVDPFHDRFATKPEPPSPGRRAIVREAQESRMFPACPPRVGAGSTWRTGQTPRGGSCPEGLALARALKRPDHRDVSAGRSDRQARYARQVAPSQPPERQIQGCAGRVARDARRHLNQPILWEPDPRPIP